MKAISDNGALLYEKVAGRIERMIEQDLLQPGDKVPSIRGLSRELKVSMSTVFQAYYQLENKGLIEARPRSGYYVKTFARQYSPPPNPGTTLKMPLNVRVDGMVSELIGRKRDEAVIDLAVSGPSTELLPVARLNKAVQLAIRRQKGMAYQYAFPPGNPNLRRLIAQRSWDWKSVLLPEDLVITNGCMEALNLCLRAVAGPGDTIAIETPAYYGVLQCIEGLGMKVLEVTTDPETGVNLDELEKALDRTRVAACLFMPSFSNPLGSCMPEEKKQKLVAMLSERQVPLIEDDVLGEIHFGHSRPRPAKSFDQEGLVLYCSSFSKTISPGLRIGWAAAGRYREKVERLKFMTSIGTPEILQEAVAVFLENGRYDFHLKKLRMAYHNQVRKYSAAVCTWFPKGTRITHPRGGHLLWIELPEHTDAVELQKRALKAGISILPGNIFTACNKYRNHIRIGCCRIWDPETEKAIKVLGQLAHM